MTTAKTIGHDRYCAQPRPRNERMIGTAGGFVSGAVDACRRVCRFHLDGLGHNGLNNRILNDIGLCRSALYADAREAHGFKDRGHGGF